MPDECIICKNEVRIATVEAICRSGELEMVSVKCDVNNLITKVSDLTTEIKLFIRLIVVLFLSAMGFLIVYWVKGG